MLGIAADDCRLVGSAKDDKVQAHALRAPASHIAEILQASWKQLFLAIGCMQRQALEQYHDL